MKQTKEYESTKEVKYEALLRSLEEISLDTGCNQYFIPHDGSMTLCQEGNCGKELTVQYFGEKIPPALEQIIKKYKFVDKAVEEERKKKEAEKEKQKIRQEADQDIYKNLTKPAQTKPKTTKKKPTKK